MSFGVLPPACARTEMNCNGVHIHSPPVTASMIGDGAPTQRNL